LQLTGDASLEGTADMLDSFRDNARSWLIQLLIGAIAVVFIFSFGPGSRGCRTAEGAPVWAARVNGNVVPVRVFVERLNSRIQQFQSYGLKPEDMKKFQMREMIMKEVVDDELLAQVAEKSGVFVNDDELAKEIEREFMRNGTFQEDRYRRLLQQDKTFEARVRRSLMAMRMKTLAQNSVTISEDEIRAAFQKEEEAATIQYVRFAPAQFADEVKITDADIDQTLAKQKEEIQKKYDANRTLYVDPHAIKARRLFVEVKANSSKEVEDAAKKRIDDAQAQLKSGKKWEEVADSIKDAASGQATDLGFVALGQSPYSRTTEENLFRLKPGERSPIVRDGFGYEILEAQEERPAAEKKLETVQRDIARDLARDAKQKELAQAAANKALAALKAGETLDKQFPAPVKIGDDANKPAPAFAAKPEAKTTEEFHPNGGVIGQLGSVPKVSTAAFALSGEKRIPDAVIEDQNAFWVIDLVGRKRADMAKFTAEKKDELRGRIETDKRQEVMEAWTKKLHDGAKVEENTSLLSYDQRSSNSPDDEG
jgi:parvulin-like peptidyl-prolyl isomerase